MATLVDLEAFLSVIEPLAVPDHVTHHDLCHAWHRSLPRPVDPAVLARLADIPKTYGDRPADPLPVPVPVIAAALDNWRDREIYRLAQVRADQGFAPAWEGFTGLTTLQEARSEMLRLVRAGELQAGLRQYQEVTAAYDSMVDSILEAAGIPPAPPRCRARNRIRLMLDAAIREVAEVAERVLDLDVSAVPQAEPPQYRYCGGGAPTPTPELAISTLIRGGVTSLYGLANGLNEMGLTTTTGKNWAPQSVDNFLRRHPEQFEYSGTTGARLRNQPERVF